MPRLLKSEPSKPSIARVQYTATPRSVGGYFLGPLPSGQSVIVVIDYYRRYHETGDEDNYS